MIRVLWFSNSPVSAGKVKNINFTGGSWIKALESAFTDIPGYQLGIVCQLKTPSLEKYVIDNVRYYICPVTSGFEKRKIGWGGNYILNDDVAVKTYLKVIDDFKPDIIQIFGTENNYGLVIPFTEVPAIIHIQGFLSMYVKKYFSGMLLSDIEKHTPTLKIIKGVTEINYFNYFKNLEARESKIVAKTKYFFGRTSWDYRIVKTLGSAKYFHCDEMLRNEFHINSWKQPSGNTIIISSTLSAAPYKGFDLIYETAEKLAKLKIPFIWNIIGSSDNAEIVRLLVKKYHHPFPLQVKMVGNKTTNELIDILLQSHIYVHPSYIDNSPNSVCEAMILGMPVCAVSTGGVPSLIDNRVDGMLVNAGDPYDMTGAILELIENPEFAKHIGENARKRSLKRHDPANILKTIISTYKIMLHESKQL